jgi:ribosomal protein S24E
LLLRLNNMETKIISEEKNPFMDREEIVLEISADVTPTFDEVKKAVGKDESLTVVKKVHTNFGRHTFVSEVFVYGSAESKNKIEVIPKKIRTKMAEDQKAAAEAKKAEAAAPAEEPAPATAEEAPAEEKKEEPAKEAPEETPKEETKE